MTKVASYTKIENGLLPRFRESMNLAESTADVQKFFVYTMLDLLNNVLSDGDGGFELAYEDIALAPGETPAYVFSPRLAGHAPLAAILKESDLPAILSRFAEVATRQYQYLSKKPEKTEAKMYHGTGRAAR